MKRPDNNAIVEVVLGTAGNLTNAAKKLNVPRTTLTSWISRDEELKVAVDDANEVLLDAAESRLYHAIHNDKSERLLEFFLKTKGKHRGYTEKIDVNADVSFKDKEIPCRFQ